MPSAFQKGIFACTMPNVAVASVRGTSSANKGKFYFILPSSLFNVAAHSNSSSIDQMDFHMPVHKRQGIISASSLLTCKHIG